jgi:hypothetical protein
MQSCKPAVQSKCFKKHCKFEMLKRIIMQIISYPIQTVYEVCQTSCKMLCKQLISRSLLSPEFQALFGSILYRRCQAFCQRRRACGGGVPVQGGAAPAPFLTLESLPVGWQRPQYRHQAFCRRAYDCEVPIRGGFGSVALCWTQLESLWQERGRAPQLRL